MGAGTAPIVNIFSLMLVYNRIIAMSKNSELVIPFGNCNFTREFEVRQITGRYILDGICANFCRKYNYEMKKSNNKFRLVICNVCKHKVIELNGKYQISSETFNQFINKSIGYFPDEVSTLFSHIAEWVHLLSDAYCEQICIILRKMPQLMQPKLKMPYLIYKIIDSFEDPTGDDGLFYSLISKIIKDTKSTNVISSKKQLLSLENKIIWELIFKYNKLHLIDEIEEIYPYDKFTFIMKEFRMYSKYINRPQINLIGITNSTNVTFSTSGALIITGGIRNNNNYTLIGQNGV
jgi:hypothetical protein